jgi:hypothetical protein
MDPSRRRAHCRSSLRRRTAFVDMVRDHIDHYLRCRADSLPLFHGLIDQRLGFNVQVMRLFDDRLCLIEKIDQRPRPWQSFLNLLKLCFAETGRLPDEFNKPVFQHSLTLLVAAAIIHWLTTTTPSGGTCLGSCDEVRCYASLS